MDSTPSEVGALLDSRSEAIRTKDIDRLMSVYSPDVVYFDLVPPLRYAGSAALRERFQQWFGRWKSAIGQEISDVNIAASGDVAVAHMLVRAGGTLMDGREVGYWVRDRLLSTVGWRVADHARTRLAARGLRERECGHGPRALIAVFAPRRPLLGDGEPAGWVRGALSACPSTPGTRACLRLARGHLDHEAHRSGLPKHGLGPARSRPVRRGTSVSSP
jgi:ketosteroid isomerase-like protein